MKPRRPPPGSQPWGPWITREDVETAALHLSVQIIKSATQILPGGAIHAGKTSYNDMVHFGFWIGVDTDDKPKINIGGPDWYLKFTGTGWDISLYAGLEDGGHVGMAYRDTDDVDRWVLEAVDSANVPFFSVETGLTDLETGLTIGYADHAKIALVNQEIVVDAAALPDLSATYSPADHTHTGLSAAPVFPIVAEDPADPAPGEGWILKTPVGGAGSGSPVGLLLILTGSAISGYTRKLSIYDSGIYRVTLEAA